MSAKWMGYFFDETDLKGSELLLALAIADHADANGFCFPGVKKLASKIRLKPRQTKILLKKLESKKYVKITSGIGRGNTSGYQLQKVHSDTPFTNTEIVHPNAPLKKEKVHSHDKKGAFSRQKKVHSRVIPLYKDEPSIETPGTHQEEKKKIIKKESSSFDLLRNTFPEENFTPNHIGFIESEVPNSDLDQAAWRNTVKIYEQNYDKARNRYIPTKIGNVLAVFRSQRDYLEKRYGTNNGNYESETDKRKRIAAEKREFFDDVDKILRDAGIEI